MSISTLESAASVRALDAMWEESDRLYAAEQYHADRVRDEIKRGDVHGVTDLSELRMRYSSAHGQSFLRRQTLAEWLAERLEEGRGHKQEPTLEEAMEILLNVAKGQDMREWACALLEAVAIDFGKERAIEEAA